MLAGGCLDIKSTGLGSGLGSVTTGRSPSLSRLRMAPPTRWSSVALGPGPYVFRASFELKISVAYNKHLLSYSLVYRLTEVQLIWAG